jgi:Flp pilus assembly pilin Flp
MDVDSNDTVFATVYRFLGDEDAQDLVEYALLGMFIGVVGVIIWQNILSLLGDRYGEYNTNVQDLWVPPDPQ